LPRKTTGEVEVTPELAMDLALLHNRDFQSQFESIYLSALALSENRYEFVTQWFGGVDQSFVASGKSPDAARLLTVTDRLGFGKQFASGGQFATSLLNSFVFEFAGNEFSAASGNIVATFTQPLLRGAFRYVRLEGLTQAERQLLYDVREFARFRRQFYLDITTSYYDLLSQMQSIRNTQANLESLELNLIEHQYLLSLKMVSQIQVDQVFQDYQNGRLSLLSAQQSLANALDSFKFQLGLPPWVQLKIDQAFLEPFELTSPDLEKLEDDAQALYLELMQYLPKEEATREQLLDLFNRFLALQLQATERLPAVQGEMDKWRARIDSLHGAELSSDDKVDLTLQDTLAHQIADRLKELGASFAAEVEANQQLRRFIESELLPDPTVAAPEGQELTLADRLAGDAELTDLQRDWYLLQEAIGNRLREQIAELYIAQTQIRLFLIEIEPLKIDESVAIGFALENRLDLMNEQGRVMDAFRRVEVSADALQSDLDVTAAAELGTDPVKANAFRFDSSANTYRVGVEFDGPLNRFTERNAYRAAQISYQQARRDYMAASDTIGNTIRSDLRELEIQRLNFQIARQQLVAATRQVDEAQFNLRRDQQADSNLTRDLLQALQGLLDAKNNLISNWIDYKTSKITLFVDLELLYLDEQGKWINESLPLDQLDARVQNEQCGPGYQPQPSIGSSIKLPVVDEVLDARTPDSAEPPLDQPNERTEPDNSSEPREPSGGTGFVDPPIRDASKVTSSRRTGNRPSRHDAKPDGDL
jgi:outer membrane protein TolC